MPTLETPPNPVPSSPTPQQPVKIATRRFGELEQHELIHLLDSIDDEISKARFRESIYISVIICLALAWFAIYGPRVLFHQGRIVTRPDEIAKMNEKELKYLDLPPSLVHKAPPKSKIVSDQDRRAQTRQPKPTPEPPKARPNAPGQQLPPTPQPQPQQQPRAQQQPQQQQAQQPPAPQQQPKPPANQNASIPDAPRPSNATKPNFNVGGSAGQSNAAAANNALQGGGGNYGAGVSHNGPQGDVEVLSDTLGVDFGPYIKRLLRILYDSWVPLIPEETRPPLNKEGDTLIRFRINQDGTLSYMHLDGSSHDDAINRAAWGSVTGVGQFPPLPKDFTGPNLDLRVHFVISHNAAKNDF